MITELVSFVNGCHASSFLDTFPLKNARAREGSNRINQTSSTPEVAEGPATCRESPKTSGNRRPARAFPSLHGFRALAIGSDVDAEAFSTQGFCHPTMLLE